MAPPFQGQGRPMNPPFPNSPHQAARSPALANSLPGTPNMNQTMPMQNPQQFNNFYPPHMQGPQVYHPSFPQQFSDLPKSSKNRKTKQQWRKNEQSSASQRSSEQQPRELFSHYYTACGPLPAEQQGRRPSEAKIVSDSQEPTEHGHSQQPQLNGSVPPGSEPQPTLADGPDYPPLPPPFPVTLPPFSPPVVGFPQLDVAQVMEMDISPEGGGFDQFLTMRQQQNYGFPPQAYADRMGMPMQTAPYMFPQMQYMNGAPQAQQPGYQQPNAYIPGQYAPQAQPMSRNSSQVSDQRPASSLGGQPQTPSMAPAHTLPPQPKASPEPSAFTRPTRKSAAIVIKKPDGEALNVENLKAPASPALRDRARTPPVIASTPTPPPKASTPQQHARTDSAALKSQEQVRLEIMEKVKKAAEATESAPKAGDGAKEAADAKLKEEKAKEEAKAKAEAETKAAADKAKQDEDDELERQIREMEEAEAEREKKEAEILAKRAAEKAEAEKASAETRKAEAAENDRKLREQEREMERLEDERERKRAEAEGKAEGGDKPDGESKDAESKAASDDKNAPATPTTIASKLSALTLGSDSGASTPASDDSMPPPPPKAASTEKRGKPAALNLAPINTKPVEPPQPSAALQSLKSARFLTVLNASLYPPNISSPNPALNTAVTTKGQSFKYDKEFLLQFQKGVHRKAILGICRASQEPHRRRRRWISTISFLEAVFYHGPPTRLKQKSSRSLRYGLFWRPCWWKDPPTRNDFCRTLYHVYWFHGSTCHQPHGLVQPSRWSFPGGSQMTRTPSSSAMGGMPHSPRQQSRSQRSGSRRDGPGNAKAEAQAAKTMPLTAGMDLKPIQVSATGWEAS